MSAYDFGRKYLFEPIGLDESDVTWMKHTDGVNYGGIGLFLTPRNMAKFGLLYLNNGSWKGNQIISKEWIIESQKEYLHGYGYQFWIKGLGYTSLGYGGQTIQIYPSRNLIIVTTCNQFENQAQFLHYLVLGAFL
jgi:CubicO group peptidase (beta-lactamase class C family)